MVYDVDIVSIPARPVVSLRRTGPLSGIGDAMRRLRQLVAEKGLTADGPMSARFYSDGGGGAEADYDVALPVLPLADGSVPDAVGEARGEWIPLHHVLQAVHRGPRTTV